MGNTVGIFTKQKYQNYFLKPQLSLQIYSTGAQGWSSASDIITQHFSLLYQNVSKISWHDAKKSGGLVINQVTGSKNKLQEHQLTQADVIFVSDQNTLNQMENQIFNSIKNKGTIIFNSDLSLSPNAIKIIKNKKINIYVYNQNDAQNMVKSNKINFYMANQLIQFLQNENKDIIKPCNQLIKVNYNIKKDQQLSIEDVYQFALDPQQENGTADQNCTITEDKQVEIGYNCINCGKCSVHCPHGCLQNVILTLDEAKELGIQKTKKNQIQIDGKTYIRQIFVDKKHCTNCGICVSVCPTNNIKLIENDDKNIWKRIEKITSQPNYYDRVRGIKQNKQQYYPAPMKGHSACAGCGQVEYYNILQRLNPKMDIIQATGCPLVYLGQYNCSPLHKDSLWINSLFEDANEVGLGVQLSKISQDKLKRPTVIIQGDGGAYDIDYNGLDQNLRSKVNLTMLVLNNQCYANTGGQKSGATPQGVQSKLGSLSRNKLPQNIKELPLQAITYKNVYVATVTSNDMKRTERIFKRALEYNGPSLVICYSPCVNHKTKKEFNYIKAQQEAVNSGAFILMEYDPEASEQNRFKIDSKITMKAKDINEERICNPDKLQEEINQRWQLYKLFQDVFNKK